MSLMRRDRFFTEEEKGRIEDAIRQVEKGTIGEVVVMVVDRSDPYPEAAVIGGILAGSLFSLILTVYYFHSSLWAFIPLSLLFFFPSFYTFHKFPLLKTPFIGLERKERAVMERAVRSFYEKGLYRTRRNTGVLFFLSLLERKVWILADRGIYERIDQETLDRFARNISQGIKAGQACEALCRAIKEIGELLAIHFPVTPGDTDELSNEVITEE